VFTVGTKKVKPLEEVVKDVWAKASDSLYGINQAPPPIPPETSTQRLEESTQKEKDSIINETTEAITKSVESNLQKEVSVVEISRGEKLLKTLSSSSTLKNSFIIKEILDKPITLRDHADRY